ncbi:hypothetical protein BCR44DRAFT_1497591 [Catenaria anguillulae PL171]|uniref:EamA domain-containing protein n=1 Tax=Catenaria anguillulae PL171 TaxID=765915 RepID=A0A1Y2HU36_9FUNG|nr:hypothetical protein BCR44DRAFT_1497591 [Catenaria anguillulae PL171]
MSSLPKSPTTISASHGHHHSAPIADSSSSRPERDSESTPLLHGSSNSPRSSYSHADRRPPPHPSSSSSSPTSPTRSIMARAYEIPPESPRRPTPRWLAGVLLLICLVAFIVQSEITAFVQNRIHYRKPYFMLWYSHSCYTLLLPFHFLFCYLYHGRTLTPTKRYLASATHALRGYTSMSNVTALYNTFTFFALVFSVWMSVDGERLHVRNVSAVVASLLGIAAITFLPASLDASGSAGAQDDPSKKPVMAHLAWFGDLMAVTGAATYGLYEATYKKYAVPPNRPTLSFATVVTGMIGVFTLLVLWIPIPILHWVGHETFQWPSMYQFGYLTLIALTGIMFNATFMLLIAFTSPVMAAVGIMLTIPCVAVVEVAMGVVTRVPFGTVVGSVVICIGFALLVSGYTGDKAMAAERVRVVDEE